MDKTPTKQAKISVEGRKIGNLEAWRIGEKSSSFQPPNRPTLQHSILPLPLLYLTFIITLAFGLRVIQLNTLPLSLSLDEAVDGLDALQLFRLGWLTPFLQNNFGRETLFFYWQGLMLQLAGISIFSLRFTSVLAGTLTVPLLYLVGQGLASEHLTFNVKRSTANMVSLLAATGLAVSYWHIYFSRVSLRAILLPPLLLGAVYCFWRGWYSPSPGLSLAGRNVSRGWLVVAGFLLGLTFYTYLAARLLPVLFVIFIITDLIRNPLARQRNLLNFLIFSGAAAITILPLALYFQQNPQALNSRTQAISIFAGNAPLAVLFDNLLALLRIHFVAHTWLGQWPALDLVSALGLLLGLLLCLYRIKKPAYFFLLLWWIIGTAPILLSEQDWAATTTLLRGIVAWPALHLISAIGLTTLTQPLIQWLKQRPAIHHLEPKAPRQRRAERGPFAIRNSQFLLPLFLLLSFGLTNVYNYFSVWATTYNDFSDHPPRIAHYLNNQTDQLTLTPLKFYGETVAHFLLQDQYPHLLNIDHLTLQRLLTSNRPTVYLLPNESIAEPVFVLLVPAAAGQGAAYLLPPLTLPQIEALAHHIRHTTPLATVVDREQEPIAQIYPLTASAPFFPIAASLGHSIKADFNNDIWLTDFRVEPPTLKPGESVTLFLNWQARRRIDDNTYLFIHLFDVSQRQRWSQVNTPLTGLLFEAYRWPVGLTVPDAHTFTLPPNAPDGAYRFEVGLYDPTSQKRLLVNDSDDKLILGKFHIWRQPPPPPQHPLTHIQFGDSVALIGLDVPISTLQPGQALSFSLHWQALTLIPQNYTVFAHLLDAVGNLRAQQDNAPQHGGYPTSWWDPGEIIIDPYTLTLPQDLAPGMYVLRIGLYEPETGQRLPLKNGGQDFVDLPNFIYVSKKTQ